MTDERKNQSATDPRPAYDPPHAIRLDQVRSGQGLCDVPGSSDIDACYSPGASASIECLSAGSGASGGSCLYPGDSADPSCGAPGNTPVVP